VVFAFFAGGGAVKFVKDYDAAGLKKGIPLMGSGFLTDGTLEAQGADAQGVLTTLHYADGTRHAAQQRLPLAYAKAYKLQPDVYAVQGYDAAQMLGAGLAAVKGDFNQRDDLIKAMRKTARIDSPRGKPTPLAQPQPGAGHLPASGRRPGEQGGGCGLQGARRSRPRLPHVN
jgi:branched-chain amino acid transport system substrate-binding protein